ncbi:MAG TPA: hypothetical protein VF181_03565 [Balneolaceae bacterium]
MIDYLKILPKSLAALIFCCIVGAFLPSKSTAQSGYVLEPIPDVWYNSVDGIRVGVRVLGYVPGTFGGGPHRLDAGIWLGTKIPEHPVSYYLSFTEPIPSISAFGSEANINLTSLYRTGFQQHGITFNKRWQTGFEERNYKELSIGFRAEHRFDEDYLLYPQLWQDDWLFLIGVDLDITHENKLGRYYLSFRTDLNLGGQYQEFIRSAVSVQQEWAFSETFSLTGRLFAGAASNQAAPEYLFMRSLETARFWMNSGLTRARGTIPPAWIEAGFIQVTGGPNLRGYLNRDIELLNNSVTPLFTSFTAFNLQLGYPNPLDAAFNNISVVGEFINLHSYLFLDTGTSLGFTASEVDELLADAGAGFRFSINIPDKLGKPRGLVIRYDIPFWVSHPGNEEPFKFRSVIGIGAVISL